MVEIAKSVVLCIIQFYCFLQFLLLKGMNTAKKFITSKNGKDAAVAYGSIDFKFKNNYDYDIKIYATSTTNNVNIKIVKL